MIYIDGEFLEEAKISVLDRGFLFGDGVYVSVLVKEGIPLFLPEQLQRLKEAGDYFGILQPEINESSIYELIEKSGAKEGRYKLQIIITGGRDTKQALPIRNYGHLIMLLKQAAPRPERPLACTLYPEPISTPHSHYKTLAHLNRYFVMDYALMQGYDDAITQSPEGYLYETAFGNLFWIYQNHLYTPDKAFPLHFGITIGIIISTIAPGLGLGVNYVKARLEDIPEAAFVYRSGSIMGIVPVERINDRKFGQKKELENAFQALFEQPLKV